MLAAIGGSTNAVLHLLAIAGRLGVPSSLLTSIGLSRDVPLLVDLQPSGRFLMEDLHYAGGVPAVMKELGALLDLDAPTVAGQPLADKYAARPSATTARSSGHRRAGKPDSGIWVLTGNLCPAAQ